MIGCKEKNLVVILNIYFLYSIITKGVGCLFAMYRSHVWPCCISFKGDHSSCWRWTSNLWKIVSEFHCYTISFYLREIKLSITIKCHKHFSQDRLYFLEYWYWLWFVPTSKRLLASLNLWRFQRTSQQEFNF